MFLDESAYERRKRHEQIVHEWIQRDFLNNYLTDKEIGEQRVIMEEFELKKRLNAEKWEIDQEAIEGLLKLQ